MKKVNLYDPRSGKAIALNVPIAQENNLINEATAKVGELGYKDALGSVIITEKQLPEDWNEQLNTSMVHSEEDIPTPKIPLPANPNQLPPAKSDVLIVSTNLIQDLHVLVGDSFYIPANSPGLNPSFPADVYLQFSTYWKQAGTAVVVGEQDYTKSVEITKGMSSTRSSQLSAELGVSYDALSAKVSATIGYSVTISEEVSVTDTYKISVPKGTTTVYVLWQLVEEYLFTDADGKPIDYNGHYQVFPATFPNAPRYNQSNTVYSNRTDFKTP